MVQFGFGARQFGEYGFSYSEEVSLAKSNGFSFLQIWYDADQGLEMIPKTEKENRIKVSKFPSVIHAVLDASEVKNNVKKLLPILNYIGHKELIIHPSTKSIQGGSALDELVSVLEFSSKLLSRKGITLYIENNSKLDAIFSDADEIKYVFGKIPSAEFIIDIAHIDDYDHLQQMVNIKYPKMLHISDRHLEVVHEHLPIGQGNIDFKYIFEKILPDYDGKIIFEIVQSTETLVNSKNYISSLII